MKRYKLAAMASIAILFGIPIGFVFSQEQAERRVASTDKTTEQLRMELSVELQNAFDGAFANYRGGGGAAPMFVLSLSRDLYKAQAAIIDPAQAEALAMQYVDHTLEIERIARLHLENGTGTRQYLSVAAAERLRAEIELKRVQQSN